MCHQLKLFSSVSLALPVVHHAADAPLRRRALLELMKDPLFKPRWNISIAEERRLALERLRMIITSGLISVTDFRTNPLRIFAAHEIAALSDVSMCAVVLCDAYWERLLIDIGVIMSVHLHRDLVVLSRATKMTVHLNLFGGSVLKLGTQRHHHLLDGIDKMQPTGCFALTELGERRCRLWACSHGAA